MTNEELKALSRAVVTTIVVVAGVMLFATNQKEIGQMALKGLDALPGNGFATAKGNFLEVRTSYRCPDYEYKETNYVYSMAEAEKRAAEKFSTCDAKFEVVEDNRRVKR